MFIMNFKKFIQTRNFFRRVTGSSHTHIYIKIKKTSVWMSFLFGGNNRARTCDPLLVRQMLSQLSYAPVSDIDYITSCGECQEFILEKSSFILSISLFKYK